MIAIALGTVGVIVVAGLVLWVYDWVTDKIRNDP